MSKHRPSSDRWARVNEDWQEQLSDDSLRDCAGEDVFKRGEIYFAAGRASMARDGGDNATFKVKGTKTYSTELYFEDVGLHTDCNCPHAQEGAFCKHMVAAALYWRCKLEGNDPHAQGNAAQVATKTEAALKRKATVLGKRAALKVFVEKQNAADLAHMLWSWAEADRALMAEITSWHAQATVADKPQDWKAAINAILGAARSYYDYRESNDYARRADNVLPLLGTIAASSPVQGRSACAYTLHKLYKVAEHADDSNGEIGDLMGQVQEILIGALKNDAPPGDWIDEWFALMEADPWGTWNEARVLAAAGAAVQQRYHARAAKDWQQHLAPLVQVRIDKGINGKKQTIKTNFTDPERYDYARAKLRTRYLDSLRQQGDKAAVLAALQTSPQGAHEHSELVAYCELIGKNPEALAFALAARSLYPDDWRTEADLLRCYTRAGLTTEALAIHRQRLERSASVEHFAAVMKAAQSAGHDKVGYRIALYDWAAQREVHAAKSKSAWQRSWTAEQGRDVSTRLEWLLYEQQLDIALALVEPPHTCRASLLHELAQRIRKIQPEQALALLHRVFAFEMPSASTPYTAVLGLVKEITPLMQQPKRGQWLALVRADYKIKRNFIKGLDDLKL